MEVMNRTIIPDCHYCKMNDSYVFIKHSQTGDEDWTVVSLKETKLCTINKGIETKI
jgi:hypothetical protein